MVEIQQIESVEGITLSCAVCAMEFSICRSCWRNQKCCSKNCSYGLKKKTHREKQRRYQSTEKGLEFGRERQRRRYLGLSLKKSH